MIAINILVPVWWVDVELMNYIEHAPYLSEFNCTDLYGVCVSVCVSVCRESSVQFSSVIQSCLTLCDPMECSTPGLPVHQKLPDLTQSHVHWVSDAIQPSHPLSSPSPPALIFPSIRVFSNESALHSPTLQFKSIKSNIQVLHFRLLLTVIATPFLLRDSCPQ